MQTLEYRYVDKSTWGNGPWQGEIDKRQWTDAETGLPCLIVRGPAGALCGYVGVAEDHPWFGKNYSSGRVGQCDEYCDDHWHHGCTPEGIISVHGGLTFSDYCAAGEPAHGICHRPDPGETDRVWWFGFDCAHYMDETPGSNARLRGSGGGHLLVGGDDVYRDAAYVEAECASLARQLAKAALAAQPAPTATEA